MPEVIEPKGIIRKTFFVSKVKDLGEGELEAIVASEKVDRANEILEMDGLDIKTYFNTPAPVVMWVHDYQQPPIGKALSLKKTSDGKLISKMKFAIEIYDFARLIYNLYKGGYMAAFSIGFLAKELDDSKEGILRWTKAEMIEFSAVPIGMNKEALLTAKAKGLDIDLLERVQKGEVKITKKAPAENQGLVGNQIAEIDKSIEGLKEIKANLEALKDNPVSLQIDVTGVQSNFELVKKITSALDKELSTDTDTGDPMPAKKKLVRIKKVAQLGDRAIELLISSINEKLKEKKWLKLKS